MPISRFEGYRREAKQNKEYRKTKKNEIQEYFRSALFAATQEEFDASHEHLMRQGNRTIKLI